MAAPAAGGLDTPERIEMLVVERAVRRHTAVTRYKNYSPISPYAPRCKFSLHNGKRGRLQ